MLPALEPGIWAPLFPFAFGVDAYGVIRYVGPSMAKLGVQAGSAFTSCFSVEVPSGASSLGEAAAGSITALRRHAIDGLLLRGLTIKAGDAWFFLGSPVPTSSESLAAAGLGISDFATHDAAPDILLLHHAHRSAMADAIALATQLGSLNQALEERVSARTAQLAEQAEMLKIEIANRRRVESELQVAHRLEAVGQLAAGIAHEINTPIQFIGDNLRFLRDAIDGQSKVIAAQDAALGQDGATAARAVAESVDLQFLIEEAPKAIEQSLEGVERVAGLVRALKEFSHPGSPERRPADLNQAIRTTLAVARNEYKYVADLEVDLDPALPEVPCHISEINQVVLNLVVNAAHALEGRAAGRGRILVTSRLNGGWVDILVADNGCGIPPAIRERIFEPFFTTKPVGKGTGQGLYLAHTIVARHHGRILVDSEVGQGTTFTVRLPVAPPEASHAG